MLGGRYLMSEAPLYYGLHAAQTAAGDHRPRISGSNVTAGVPRP